MSQYSDDLIDLNEVVQAIATSHFNSAQASLGGNPNNVSLDETL